MMDTPVNPACWMWEKEDQELNIILGCTENRRALQQMGEKRLSQTSEQCQDCHRLGGLLWHRKSNEFIPVARKSQDLVQNLLLLYEIDKICCVSMFPSGDQCCVPFWSEKQCSVVTAEIHNWSKDGEQNLWILSHKQNTCFKAQGTPHHGRDGKMEELGGVGCDIKQ